MNLKASQTDSLLEKSGFTLFSEERGVTIFKKEIVPTYCHTITFWPNKMIEFSHYSYGRVFYGPIGNLTDL